MNQVNLVGRITRDLTLRKTNDGTSFTGFTVAISEYRGGKEYTNFIDCVAFGNQAENITRYVGKGSLISVIGRLSVRKQNDNGNYSTIVNVNVDRVEFLESKASRQQNQNVNMNNDNSNPVDFDAINNFNNESYELKQNNQDDNLKDDDEILWD